MIFPNGIELRTGAGLGPLAQAEMERHGARPVMPHQITDTAMRRIDAGGTSMEAMPANLPRPVPVATPSPETMPAPSGAALGGLQDTPALTDSDRNHAVMMAGLRMMQAASRPGATALGALADGGVTGMQTADALRQRNIQSAAAQQQAERDDLRFRMDIERHNADMAKSRRPEIQKFYDELGREITGYLDDRGNVVQVGGAKSGSGEAPKTITDGTGQVWAYNPGTGVFDVKVGAPKPNGGRGTGDGKEFLFDAKRQAYLAAFPDDPDAEKNALLFANGDLKPNDPDMRKFAYEQAKEAFQAEFDSGLHDGPATDQEIQARADGILDYLNRSGEAGRGSGSAPQQAPGADMAAAPPLATGDAIPGLDGVTVTESREIDGTTYVRGSDGNIYEVTPDMASAEQGQYPDARQMDPSEWQAGEIYSVPGKGAYRYLGNDQWAPMAPHQGQGAHALNPPPVRPLPVPPQSQQPSVPVTQPPAQAAQPDLPLTPPDMGPTPEMARADLQRLRNAQAMADKDPQALQTVMREIRMVYGGMEEFKRLLREVPSGPGRGPDVRPVVEGD
ncbi:MAG: hypothetical protein JJ878_15685 [Alphaproteobacteria bacterium]|nr:hypothetical protein [Alphaproteobacteria bacterium]